jgi:sulfatase modifying factor 1
MKRVSVLVAALALLVLSIAAQAAVTIDTVPVGNPGNAGEPSGAGAGGYGADIICGSVGYAYNVGKYEVTAGQYTAFLNAVATTDTYGLYTTSMDTRINQSGCNIRRSGDPGSYTYAVDSASVNRPVNYVSWGDSARFANWLHNGQPTGLQDASTTEDGAYYLNGATTDAQLLAVNRKAGWTWAITSEDEWYKAAYYKGGSTSAGYWDYPTQSDIPTAPSNVGSDGYTDPGNHANYYDNVYTIGFPIYRTNVGEFENSASAYGTFDQGGNVWEWNEAIIKDAQENDAYRGIRGGSFGSTANSLQASVRSYYDYAPSFEENSIGFRVSAVPEPSSLLALGSGILALAGMIRRKR